jgi:hypothetical protein
LLPGSPTLGWYLVVVVLDVVRGERGLDLLMLNIMHARTLVGVLDKTRIIMIVSICIPTCPKP